MAFNTRSFLTGPIPTPQRVIGLTNNAPGGVNYLGDATPVKPLLGFQNLASLQVGSEKSAAGFFIQAGGWIPAEKGNNMSLTIATGSGSLGVVSNGLDITVTLASGGSHASAVVAAINAQLPSSFVLASLNQGSAGGTNVAALAKTYFVASNRFPALP
jgi:hypothetical protein